MLSSASLFLLLQTGLLASAQTSRQFTFVNKCSSDVWFSPTTGAAGPCSAGCPSGTTCQANGNCYYNNPKPSSGTYRVPKGGQNVVTYPHPANNGNTIWNGNFAFCQSGQTCSQTASVCDSQGCATTGPYALAEFYLSNTGSDFYDVSIIAGVAVPVSITPQIVDSTNSNGNPYTCGNPGSPTPDIAGLAAVSWNLSPPSSSYQWVTPPNLNSLTTCSAGSSCPSGQTCGLIYNAGNFKSVCGYLSGYWSAGAVCGTQPSTTLFGCNTPLNNGPYTGTYSSFYGCGDTSGSCYSGGADTQCCGCANWNNVLGTNYVPASTQQCVNSDPNWTNIVLPTIEWLKKGCPSCYTFPYDDPSSTFTCTKAVNNYNTQNYTITLCPNGVSWGGTTGVTLPGTTTSPSTTTSPRTTTSNPPATTTKPGSGPTGSAGTCAGKAYTSSQVCDNGHICPTGQYFCGSACYNPATSCCNKGGLSPATGACECANGQIYDGANYVCDNNTLCPKGTYNCGGGCFSPSLYGCCGGALTAVGQGC